MERQDGTTFPADFPASHDAADETASAHGQSDAADSPSYDQADTHLDDQGSVDGAAASGCAMLDESPAASTTATDSHPGDEPIDAEATGDPDDDLPSLIFEDDGGDRTEPEAASAPYAETESAPAATLTEPDADVPNTLALGPASPVDVQDVPADDAGSDDDGAADDDDGMADVTGEYIAFGEEAVATDDASAAEAVDGTAGADEAVERVEATIDDDDVDTDDPAAVDGEAVADAPSPFVDDAGDQIPDEYDADVEVVDRPELIEEPTDRRDPPAADVEADAGIAFDEPEAVQIVEPLEPAAVDEPSGWSHDPVADSVGSEAEPVAEAVGLADAAPADGPEALPEPPRARRKRPAASRQSIDARPPARGVYDDAAGLTDGGDAADAYADYVVGEPVDEVGERYQDVDPDAESFDTYDGGEVYPGDPGPATVVETDGASELADGDEDDDLAEPVAAGRTGGGWTIPLLCAGIAVIACCVVIPQADANRRLAYQRAALRAELESVQTQVATNDDFLRKLASDPTLAERLAQRQMRMVRVGTKPLPVNQSTPGTSPFDLVQVAPPATTGPYEPVGGRVAEVCYNPRSRLYLMGGGLFLLAAGLVLGSGGRRGYE